jgi:hypothetical protein
VRKISKIVEFKIGKGKTAKPSPDVEEWTRKYIELTIKLPEQFTEQGFHEAVAKAEMIIDDLLKQPETPQIPHLDIAEIGDLLWTRYKDRAKAERDDEAAWTFSDPAKHDNPEHRKTVEKLVKAIKGSSDGKLRIGNVEFSLSGENKQFVSRKPAAHNKP